VRWHQISLKFTVLTFIITPRLFISYQFPVWFVFKHTIRT